MDNPTNSAAATTAPEFPRRNYALSGKIMLAAIVILFTVVLLILCFHVYARWYLLCRSRRRRRRSRRLLVFTSSDRISPHASAAANRGLDPTVLKSLPVHSYSAATESEECAVCLCEFEEKDACRTLPGCVHTFHIECIDMWLFSHSTCPLCRSAVESPALPSPSSVQIGIPDDPWGSGSSSSSSSSSSSASTPGRGGMRVEVPARRPAEAEEHKSPVLTIKGVLSMDLGFHHEGDLEMGGGGGREGGGAGGSDTDDGAAMEGSAPFPESVDGNPAVDRDTCQRGGISLC